MKKSTLVTNHSAVPSVTTNAHHCLSLQRSAGFLALFELLKHEISQLSNQGTYMEFYLLTFTSIFAFSFAFRGMKWPPSRQNKKLRSKKWSQNFDWRPCDRVIDIFLLIPLCKPIGHWVWANSGHSGPILMFLVPNMTFLGTPC